MMPAVFIGHGNPMYALADNAYTRAWSQLGHELPRPKAILAISAHWFIPSTSVTIAPMPRTIHDFGGFPKELYEVQYAAAGDVDLARRVQEVLAPLKVELDEAWGLDHGTWAVLRHVYPAADVPVVQLSIDKTQPAAFHFDLGRRLAALREENILILGSGNIVHNLHAYAWGRRGPEPFDWATRFEATAKQLLGAGEYEPLIRYETLGQDAMLSIPTPDHYLPLMYVIGSRQSGESVSFRWTAWMVARCRCSR